MTPNPRVVRGPGPQLTHKVYLNQLYERTENYKNARNQVETVFNKSEGLPDVDHKPIESKSDEENLEKKRKLYQWDRSDGYPPHLKIVPKEDSVALYNIFSKLRLLEFALVQHNVKEFFSAEFNDETKVTMSMIQQRYQELHKAKEHAWVPDIYTDRNFGLRADWYTDAAFAQQSFTGVNPIGIRHVSTVKDHDWLAEFRDAATDQKNDSFHDLLKSSKNDIFYVVDNSQYRTFLDIPLDQPLFSGPNDGGDASNPLNNETGAPPTFGAASVTLYTLDESGRLHPVAICLDYRGPLGSSKTTGPSKSVTIFNKRLTPDADWVDQATDWPWRYAKMTASMSDWLTHELTSHLTETHLVEEATIVAAQRTLPDSHIVYQLLQPHWFKTLSLNSLARSALVPIFIKPIAPIPHEKTMKFINNAYTSFQFTDRYIPAELASRGFSFDDLKSNNKKFHNYLYARGVVETWSVLRNFVSDVLRSVYPDDAAVKADTYVSDFGKEMRKDAGTAWATDVPPTPPPAKKEGWFSKLEHAAEDLIHTVEKEGEKLLHWVEGKQDQKPFVLGPVKDEGGGALASFPIPETLDELIDMVTMCIHIAVPQHNAINYLQQYYLAFLPNRPAAFDAPLPTTIDQLNEFAEDHLVDALPIGTDADKKQWMGMAQLPYLLSSEVDPESNIIQYATDMKQSTNPHIQAAAEKFYGAVTGLEGKFDGFNAQMDDQQTLYHVLNPERMALSILI